MFRHVLGPAAALLLMTSPVLAAQCPADAAAIDAALETAEVGDDVKAEAQALRDEGMAAHEAGDHDGAMSKLGEAKAMLGIE